MNHLQRQTGATLIELVVSTVIIAITVTAVMMVIAQVARSSADPMHRVQATAIAQAYMDEILSQHLDDPDGGELGGPEPGETRASFDDVADYHRLDDAAGAVDQTGVAIGGLEGYNVSVAVTATTIQGFPAKRIQVSVGFDGDPDFVVPLVSYRLN
jgi:MSHA pilin protein MshD